MISTSSAMMKYKMIAPPKRPRNLFTDDLSELGMVLFRLFKWLMFVCVNRSERRTANGALKSDVGRIVAADHGSLLR